jgi:magnesium transporter
VRRPGTLWLALDRSELDRDWLAQRFGFHPLMLEEAATDEGRPRLDDDASARFLVLNLCMTGTDEGLLVTELDAFLTANALVTVRHGPVPALEAAFVRCASDPSLLARGPDFALYLVLDGVTDAHFNLADRFTGAIDELVDDVVAGARPDRELLERILRARRAHAGLRRKLAPQREVFLGLARPGDARVRSENLPYFRELVDHLARITEEIDIGRDLLASTLDAHLAIVNNRMNLVMTRLTLVATIFLPLSFLTGFFGMNLPLPSARIGWPIVLGAIAVLPPALWLWFRRHRWVV